MTTVFLKPASAGADIINDSGVDIVFGSLSPFFIDGQGPTLNTGDSIQNVASLIITDGDGTGFDFIPAGVTLANIANVQLITAGNAGQQGQPFDTAPFTGIGALSISSSGPNVDFVNAGPTTPISENQNSSGNGAGAVVTGGSTVVVTSYGGGGVSVGGSNLGVVPLPGQLPTGAVFITENGQGNGTGNAAVGFGNGFSDVHVFGGTSVTVVANSPSYQGDIEIGNTGTNTGNSAFGGSANPTGPIVVADSGVSNGFGFESGGGSVIVFGGSSVVVNAAGDYVQVGDDGNFSEAPGSASNAALNNTKGNVTVNNIAPVVLSNIAGVNNEVDVYGGNNVTVYTNTGGVVIGDTTTNAAGTALQPGVNPTGDIVVTDTATANGGANTGVSDPDIFIAGGHNVTVAASGLDISIGDIAVFGPAGFVAAPTGAITVTDFSIPLYDGILNTHVNDTDVGSVEIYGGTTVNVATNSGFVYVGDTSGTPGANPTGDVAVTDLATGFVPFFFSSSGGGSDAPDSVDVFGGHNVAVFAASGSVQVGGGIDGGNPTGDVVVAEIGINTGDQYENHIAVEAGHNVTIVTTGAGGTGSIFEGVLGGGFVLPGISVGSDVGLGGSPVTGAVTIYDLYSGRHNEPISVLGGTTVSINETVTSVGVTFSGQITIGATPILNVAGTAATNLADDPTGTVQIDDSSTFGSKTYFGTEAFTVTTNGSAVVYVQGGGNGTITDAQSTLTGTSAALGTSTLSTVILDGVTGTTAIIDDALANLTIANVTTAQAETVNLSDDKVNSALTVTLGAAHHITLNTAAQGGFSGTAPFVGLLAVNAVGTGANDIAINSPGVTLLAINDAAGTSLQLDAGSALGGVKKILVTGAGSSALGDFSGAALLTSVDASGNSGGVGIQINPGHTSFLGGSGNDTLVINQNLFGLGVSLNGGGGNNVVYANYAAAGGDIALGTIALAQFSGFQNFGVEGAAQGLYSVQGFTGLVVGGLFANGGLVGPSGAIDFENVAQGAGLALIDTGINGGTASNPGFPVTYHLAAPFAVAAGVGGSVTIQDGLDGTAVGTFTTTTNNTVNFTGDNITSVTVNSQGSSAGGAGNELHLTGFSPTAMLSKLTITGDNSLTMDPAPNEAVTVIDASASTGPVITVSGVGLAVGGATISGGTGELVAQGYLGPNVTPPAPATTILATSAKDVFNVGSGGALITLGEGGAGFNAGAGTSKGSETVNLLANAKVGTTILAAPNVDAATGATDGAYGIVNNWSYGTVPSGQTADSVFFTAQPVVIANSVAPIVGAHASYNVVDGVITSTGTVSFLNELSDAQAIVDAGPVGTLAMVTIFASQSAPVTATYLIENEGGGAKDVVVQLNSLTGETGFGAIANPTPTDTSNIGGGSSVGINTALGGFATVDAIFANVTDTNILHTGSATANQTTDEKGANNIVHLTASGTGFTTTYNNVGNYGVVEANTAGGGNLTVTQVGVDPLLTLLAEGTVNLGTLTYGTAGDVPTLIVDAVGGNITIGSVVDASNSGTELIIAGPDSVTIKGVTDTALTKIDAGQLMGDLNLTANGSGLTILDQPVPAGAVTNSDTIIANGAADTITIGSTGHLGTHGTVLIQAGGAGDHISVFSDGFVDIGAAGIGDVISVAGSPSGSTITGNGVAFGSGGTPGATQLGSGDTINVGDTKNVGHTDAWLGTNSTVNLGTTSGGTHSTAELHLLGDTAGAAGTNITVVNGVDANGDNLGLTFNVEPGNFNGFPLVTTEAWAGGNDSLLSQVNVATAATLGQALNIAASQALVLDQQFSNGFGPNTQVINQNLPNAALQLDAHTGLVDWFQFGGNTFLVEAVNNTNNAATHGALGANDIVVELTGLVDASHIGVATHVGT